MSLLLRHLLERAKSRAAKMKIVHFSARLVAFFASCDSTERLSGCLVCLFVRSFATGQYLLLSSMSSSSSFCRIKLPAKEFVAPNLAQMSSPLCNQHS